MAIQATMGGAGELFVGEDKTLKLELIGITGLPVDMTGWGVRCLVLSKQSEVLIDKNASITGVYNAARSDNTQRAVVTLTDSDMSIQEGVHRHSWKRTDDGSETVLAYGDCIIERATQA